MHANVIVIGGGVMGTSIALHAARRASARGESVLLLEKRELAAGESGRSGAILRQHYSDRMLAGMARDSLRVYASFEARTGRSISFQRMGVLTLAGSRTPESVELVRRNVGMMQSIGITTEFVLAPRIRSIVPGIAVTEDVVGGYEPEGGGVDPVRTVEAFAALAREAGAATRVGCRANEIVVRNSRVVGISTDDGIISAEQVVVAAGPWTGPILERIGVEVPLRVVRPEQSFFALPALGRGTEPEDQDPMLDAVLDRFGLSRSRLARAAHPVILDLDLGYYTRCESHALRTRVGRLDYTRDEAVADPDQIDETVSEEFQDWARAALCARLPVYADRESVGNAVGLYTLTPDSRAVIGPARGVDGLFVVSGFSGHGFKLAPSVGEGVAQMIFGEPVSAFDPSFFALERFQEPERRAATGAFGL